MKIAVLSPHRDDAAFSLGLSIGVWLEAGHEVEVVNCFTRTTYAPHADFESIHSNDRLTRVTALRHREDLTWQKMYGGRKPGLHDLNLKDAPLRLHVRTDQVCALPIDPNDKALVKVPKAVAALGADALVIPLALGSHVDHLTVRAAILATDLPSDMPMALYEDLPYAARPEATQSLEREASLIEGNLRSLFVTTSVQVEAAEQRKRRLALCYDSQIADDVATQIATFCHRYEGRERIWGNAAWCASELVVGHEVP